MAMTMNGTVQLPAKREVVWEKLNNPEVLKSCIPGCEQLDMISNSGPNAKLILLALLAFSLISWAIILAKWSLLRRARAQSGRFVRAFRKAQSLDPNCAMCFLGEALVLGPNINAPMDPAANAPTIAALKKALELAAGATQKEKDIIAAVATRYSEDPAADRHALDNAFADATAALSDKYPDDLDLATLAAEAAMDTQPWDYWQPGGKEGKGREADIQKRLEGVGLDAAAADRLKSAVGRAEEKGSRESLILVDDLAFVVSVKNKTVITAVDQGRAKENVFTNIDSVVIG